MRVPSFSPVVSPHSCKPLDSNSRRVRRAIFALILPALVAFAVRPAHAQNLFPASPVGASSSPQTVQVTVTAAGTVQTAEYLTLGTANLDYASAGSGDSCTGATLASGQTCTVKVVFTPKAPGVRNGAVVLLDSSNNVLGTAYVTGSGQGAVAVMVPGTVSIEAGQVGQWTQPGDGGPATKGDLYLPSGIAVDGAGDVFIADSNHNRVREVLATAQNGFAAGDIITVAGDGDAGYNGAGPVTATKSPLNIPSSVAIDGAGNLYIADTNNNVVREVNLTLNTMITVAGNNQPGYTGDNGAPTAAEVNSPRGVTIDAQGNLYIADTGNNVIREVTGGKITTIVGTGVPGSTGDGAAATSATLDAPYAVAFDPSGKMYIPDSAGNRIRVVSGGIINTFAGNGTAGYAGDGGKASAAELDTPFGVACDAAGNVYVADARNYVLRKVNAVSGKISTVAGVQTMPAYADGKSDFTYGNNQSGENYTGDGIATGAGIYAPYAVAVDSFGNLYVAEYFDHIVREVNADQATLFFSPQLWVNQVSAPQSQAIENDGNADLSFTSIAGDANSAVGASSGCSTNSGSNVSPDTQCTVAAEFAPTVAGNPQVGTISVGANSSDAALSIAAVGQALAQNQVTVNLTSTPNPSNFGQTVTFSVTVVQSTGLPAPTGTVNFTDTFNGTTNPVGTTQTLAGGKASLQLSTLAVGTHQIVANYSGSTSYQPASSNPLSQVVNEQITVVVVNSSGNNPSILGASVTFQATVTVTGGTAITNPVSFYDGTTLLGTASANGSGVATFSTTTLALGSNSITASYTDTNNITGTSKPLVQMVEQQTSTTVTSNNNPSTYGSSVTFTATVLANGTVAPTGKVTFYDGATSLGTGTLTGVSGNSGTATFTTTTLAVGTHNITATYAGDTNDFSSTSTPVLAQVVTLANTATTLTVSANPAIAGSNVTFTATVGITGTTTVPTGKVNFYNGTTLLGSGTLNARGVATYSTSSLAVGTYSITAAYQGDANNNASTSAPLSFSVIEATTQISLTASSTAITVGTPVMFTATVTGNGSIPTGTVTFLDGTTSLGTSTLNAGGIATLTTSALPVGTQSVTASYSGDANNKNVTSTAVSVTVTAWTSQTVLAASATNISSTDKLTLLATASSGSGQPLTGTMTFVSGGTTLGTANVSNGAATLQLSLNAGSYTIVAKYSGDSLDLPSASNSVSVTVGQSTDFSETLSPASLNIPTTQYGVTTINLKSEAGFTDTIALGCSSLPFSVTCSFSNNDVTLAANGTASVQLTVDTNSPLVSGGQAKNEMPGPHGGLLAACLFPGSALFGFTFWRFRKRHSVLKVLAIVAMLAGGTFLMNGCGGLSLNSAKAGTYTIQVTATGEKTATQHVANLSVQVTQ